MDLAQNNTQPKRVHVHSKILQCHFKSELTKNHIRHFVNKENRIVLPFKVICVSEITFNPLAAYSIRITINSIDRMLFWFDFFFILFYHRFKDTVITLHSPRRFGFVSLYSSCFFVRSVLANIFRFRFACHQINCSRLSSTFFLKIQSTKYTSSI